jgi:hypothetical protein
MKKRVCERGLFCIKVVEQECGKSGKVGGKIQKHLKNHKKADEKSTHNCVYF